VPSLQLESLICAVVQIPNMIDVDDKEHYQERLKKETPQGFQVRLCFLFVHNVEFSMVFIRTVFLTTSFPLYSIIVGFVATLEKAFQTQS
jgi:hypothetical protein